jgi:hypothetical protein
LDNPLFFIRYLTYDKILEPNHPSGFLREIFFSAWIRFDSSLFSFDALVGLVGFRLIRGVNAFSMIV